LAALQSGSVQGAALDFMSGLRLSKLGYTVLAQVSLNYPYLGPVVSAKFLRMVGSTGALAPPSPSPTASFARPSAKAPSLSAARRSDAPGVRRKITPGDMPPPYETASANRGPTVVARPANAWPKAPPGFCWSEAGKIELHDEPVAIADTIASALRLVTPRARENGLLLDTVTADDGIVLNADGLRLKQVILNLLSNSVKFTPTGGRVTVRTGILHDGNFMLTVTDTGIGIAEDDLAVVLTPFGQVDSKLSRKYEGTGLGLPLSLRLMELHGGTLAIDSALGRGTTVTVTFPITRVVVERAAA